MLYHKHWQKHKVSLHQLLQDTRNFGTNYTNPPLKQVGHQLGWHPTITYHNSQNSTHQIYRSYKDHTPIQTHINQQTPIKPPSTSINQLLNSTWQTKLTHSTQQTTDVLNNIASSSSHQENLHFINDIPLFKVKICNLLMNVWNRLTK